VNPKTDNLTTDALMDLDELGREVLFSLPFGGGGPSLHELADELLEDRSPRGLAAVRRALAAVELAAGLERRTGMDAFGLAGVPMYALPRAARRRVRTFAALLGKKQGTGNIRKPLAPLPGRERAGRG